jgi:transcription initiation factor TFIID subunit 5
MESERIILSYLKNRGLKQTEASLRSEAKLQKLTTDPNLDSIPEFLIFYNEKESNDPLAFDKSYTALRKWILDSIDFYKVSYFTNASLN